MEDQQVDINSIIQSLARKLSEANVSASVFEAQLEALNKENQELKARIAELEAPASTSIADKS